MHEILSKKAKALQYRDRVVSHLPELRRFAGALVAPGHVQSNGAVDDLVVRSAAAVMRERLEGDHALRLALYGAVIRFAQGRDLRPTSPPAPGSFAEGLLSLQLHHRAALLLVTLERFTYEEAAAILGVSRSFLVAKLSTARQVLARRMEGAGARPTPHLRVVK